MSETHPETALQNLLEQRAWLQELCQSLVRNPADAADLSQQSLLSSLRQRLPVLQPRAWLRTVAQNHARQQHRQRSRAARHHAAAASQRPDTAPSAAETSAAFEAQRLVVTAVHELPEPFRSTVLRHYFDGMTLAAIARAAGDPEGTVRWRLAKAHSLLRERLEERCGRDWRGAVLPLCTAPLRRSLPLLAFAAVALLGTAGLLWPRKAASPPRPEQSAVAAYLTLPLEQAANTAPVREAAPSPGTVAIAPPPAPPRPRVAAGVPLPAQQAMVRARILDHRGQPLANAQLRLDSWHHGNLELSSPFQELLLPPATSDAHGQVALPLHTDERLLGGLPASMRPAAGEPWRLGFSIRAAGHLPLRSTHFLADGDELDLGTLTLAPAATLRGTVVAQDGSALVGAHVGVFGCPLPTPAPNGSASLADLARAAARTTTSGWLARGQFQLEPVPLGPVLVLAIAEGYRSAHLYLDLQGTEATLPALVLDPIPATTPPRGPELLVLDPAGLPVPAALVQLRHRHGSASARTGPDGTAQFARLLDSSLTAADLLQAIAIDPTGLYEPVCGERLAAADGTVRLQLGPKNPTTVQVHSPPAAAGKLVASWVSDDDGIEFYLPVQTLDALRFTPPPFAASLRIRRDRCLPWTSAVYPAGAWPTSLTVELQPRAQLRGEVQAGGQALAGARVRVLREGPAVLQDGFRTSSWRPFGPNATTDARGNYVLDGLDQGRYRLLVAASDHAPAASEAFAWDPTAPTTMPLVALSRGGRLQGTLRQRDGTPLPRRLIALSHELFGLRTTFTDREGRFAFAALAAGDYVLRETEPVDQGATVVSSLPSDEGTSLATKASVLAGQTTAIELVAEACELQLEVQVTGLRHLLGWTAELLDPADGRRLAGPANLRRDGKLTLAAEQRGTARLQLRSPGGPFGDLTVRLPVSLEPGSTVVPVALSLAAWHQQQAGLPQDAGDHAWLLQTANGMEVEARGRCTAATGTLDFALAPLGACELVVRGTRYAVDTRPPR